jgi:putative ABC transport system substrate-binding protein
MAASRTGAAEDGLRHIAMLLGRAPDNPEGRSQLLAFEQELQSRGWIKDRSVATDYRWAGGDPTRFASLAKEIVRQRPDVIVAQPTVAAAAIFNETRVIPTIFVAVTDPISSGFVKSLSRPEGNMTGLVDPEPSLGGKWVELLKELVPQLTMIARLFNPETAAGHGSHYFKAIEAAASSSGLKAEALPVRSADEITSSLARISDVSGAGLVVMPDIFNGIHSHLIVSTVARLRVPAVYAFKFFVASGEMASYGIDLVDLYRRAAIYADRILRGARPADLPIELPTKFEMAVNLKATRMLGISVPPTLLSRADEVIE